MTPNGGLAAGLLGLLFSTAGAGAVVTAGAGGDGEYAIVDSVAGPDGMWDYAAVDGAGRRLYIAQSDHISILPLPASRGSAGWMQIVLPGAMWHGVVPLAARGVLLATNGQGHGVAVYDAGSRELQATVAVDSGRPSKLSGKFAKFAVLADPDALVFEPKNGLVAAVNGGSGEVVFVNLERREVVSRVHVGGKLEFAVVDTRGRLYVNVQTAHEIAVVDVAATKVVQRIPLAGCIEPKGLAYDEAADLLISACDNGVVKFIETSTARTVASLPIGHGADAVMVDEARHRVFVASGEDAMLRIFDIADPRHIALTQSLPTEKGVRLGAVDVHSGLLYLPSATLGPPIAPRPWPSAVAGTFHVLVVGQRGSTGAAAR